MKQYIAAAAAGMALVCTAHADGITDHVHLELGAGVSWYHPLADGTWYQQGMPHDLGLSAPALMAGFTGPVWQRESWGVDWHADYVYLARVHSSCLCTSDENYNAKTRAEISNATTVPLAQYTGSGNAQGIALTLEPYVRYRGFRIGVEGGLFPYRPQWDETVTSVANLSPYTIYAHTPHAIQLGEVVGVSVGRGPWSISYQHYFLPTRYDDTHYPAIYNAADVVMLRYRF